MQAALFTANLRGCTTHRRCKADYLWPVSLPYERETRLFCTFLSPLLFLPPSSKLTHAENNAYIRLIHADG